MDRIRKFQSHCKFRKTILSYIAAFVNDEDIKQEIALFNQIDRDKDGYITKKEFKKANKKFKLGFDVDAVFKALDMDKNEAINFNEFIAAIMDEKAAKNPKKLLNAFNFFDADHDGVIGKEDFKQRLKNDENISICDTVIEDIMNEIDEDGDGNITYKEFYRCMSMQTARKSIRDNCTSNRG